ncbi:MAG: class I SAM-dependent methyltransferase, partial [Fibrobacteres bacterium]|nr:class I SAM-dependent methyltransferase [Fibrobacterota bacterium]
MQLKDFKQKILEDIKRIEKLPEEGDNDPVDLKSCSYPLSRGKDSYFKKLPNLEKFLKPNMNVLDIGAGNCIAISEIANSFPDGKYFGTGVQDLESNYPNVSFKIATACNLPFADNYFDVVISVHGLSWEL